MANYLDGFVLSIPRARLADYRRLAAKAGRIWRAHGALEYREYAADDVKAPGMVPFPKLAKARRGDVVIFAFATFRSRRHRDAANKKIMADPKLAGMCEASQGIVDCRRMAYGGFLRLVAY